MIDAPILFDVADENPWFLGYCFTDTSDAFASEVDSIILVVWSKGFILTVFVPSCGLLSIDPRRLGFTYIGHWPKLLTFWKFLFLFEFSVSMILIYLAFESPFIGVNKLALAFWLLIFPFKFWNWFLYLSSFSISSLYFCFFMFYRWRCWWKVM